MITITDSMPSNPTALHKKIDSIQQMREIEMIGIGLGPETQNVLDYYPSSRHLQSLSGDPFFSKLFPQIIADLLTETILGSGYKQSVVAN